MCRLRSSARIDVTRPAFSRILPWHANYAIPPSRREAARARTQHLGLSSLDIDTVYDDFSRAGNAGGVGNVNSISGQYEAAKREQERTRRATSLLPLGRKSLSNLLGGAQYSDRFKLDAVANNFFAPLAAQLGNKRYLLSDERPSSVDCLAFGYLALMLYPQCPQAWLKDSITTRFPTLEKYTENLRGTMVGNEPVDTKAAIAGHADPKSLPWQSPTAPTATRTITSTGRGIIHALPIPPILSYLNLRAPSDTTRSTITRILTFSSLAFSILAGVAYHFATINPAEWDFVFKASDFTSEARGPNLDSFGSSDPNTMLAALEKGRGWEGQSWER